MANRVLVAYESRGGATREIAEEVAHVLAEHGMQPDLRHIRGPVRHAEYDAYVLGAPVRMGRWAPRMQKFIRRGKPVMAERPIAVFAVGGSFGPPDAATQADPQKAEEHAAYAEKCRLAVMRWCDELRPMAFATFPGVMRAKAFPVPASWAMRASKMPAEDARDWGEIRAWGAEVASKLRA